MSGVKCPKCGGKMDRVYTDVLKPEADVFKCKDAKCGVKQPRSKINPLYR